MKFNKLNHRYAYVGQFKLENLLPGLQGQSIGSSLTSIDFSGVTTFLLPTGTTLGGSSLTALGTITSSSANALTAGLNGATNPAFNVDASTASQAAGLNIIGATAAGTVAVAVISSGANASMTFDAKGSGTLGINTVSTTAGLVTLGNSTSGKGILVNGPSIYDLVPAAINSTATATAAQVATGYITSTSGAATTITLPTGTLLGTQLGATQGMVFDLFIDNTAGSNTVTMAVAVNGILSAAAAANAASQGLLTVPSGVTGQACFRLMFSSSTAYTFTRIA